MTAQEQISEGINLISHDVRAEILLALADQKQEIPRDEGLRFSELRKRVGHDDPGNFNYHLNRLQGHLVEQVDGEYRLSDIGHHFVVLLSSKRFDQDSTRDFSETDIVCPACDSPVTVNYDDGMLRTNCNNNHKARMNVGPELLDTHSMSEALNIGIRRALWETLSVRQGVCPDCDQQTTGTVVRYSNKPIPVAYEWVCEGCGGFFQNTPAGCVLFHPAVVSFCYRRGIDIYEQAWTTFVKNVGNGEVRSEDPLRVEIEISVAGDKLQIMLNETASIVNITQS